MKLAYIALVLFCCTLCFMACFFAAAFFPADILDFCFFGFAVFCLLVILTSVAAGFMLEIEEKKAGVK